ncbi:putative RTA1 domain protein [Neofusicoccum parvum]|nr:putative RTA1 domain protein [Neofusicoccum parvum]
MSHPTLSTRGEADFDLYPYNPSAAAGYAFVVLFGIGGAVHLVFVWPLRAWFFIPLILGCVGEAFGYYGRAQSHDNIRNGSPYLLQLMLILASAPLVAATIYMTLGRIIRTLDAEHHAMIRTRWLTKLYVVIDVGSFVCQMMGSAMQSSGDPAGVKLGIKIVVGGLGFQLAAFLFFIAMAWRFHFRLNREPTSISRHPQIQWRRDMWVLYTTSILIFVRSTFRIIEFVEGNEGAIYTHEAFLYVFDAFLMFLVVTILAVFHPARLIKNCNQIRKSRANEEDVESILITSH